MLCNPKSKIFMASTSNLTTPTRFLPLSNSIKDSSNQSKSISYSNSKDLSSSSSLLQISRKSSRNSVVIRSVKEEASSEVIEIRKLNEIVNKIEKEREYEVEVVSSVSDGKKEEEKSEFQGFVDRTINATIVLAAGTFAITRLLTIDHDYWQGWTFYEILRYAPEHNWLAYEEALKSNPVLAKMAISGVVYSLGDWIAQCVEGKPLFEFDRTRAFRSGLVGFALHGSLSHYYYQFCESLIPYKDWWVVPAKIAFDQTVWAAIWNSIYFVVLGLLRFESPANIYSELKETFQPMLTAGWKLWPFAHIITYGVIPVEQRLLWVDCVELIWVTILSTYSNEKSEERISEATPDSSSTTSPEK